MICKKCGAQVPDETIKCEFCGELLADEPTQVIDINESGSENVSNPEQRSTHDIFEENARKRKEQVEKAKNEKQHQLDEITERRNAKQQRRKRNKTILICAICIAVIAAAGAGTYMYKIGMFNNNDDPIIATPDPNAPATPIPTIAPVTTPAPSPSAQPTSEAQSNNETNTESGTNWTATNSSRGDSSNSSSNGSSSQSGSSSSGSSSSGNTSSGGSSSNTSSGSSSSGSNSSSNGSSTGSSSSGSSSSGTASSASGKLTSALATGGKVIKDSTSGKSFMTFTINGKTYYANVSPDSTTDQIQNKTMTITATPTSAKYDGNTVYEISSLTYYDGTDYILPDSGTKLINKADIQNLSKDKLSLARNEIYARHGRKFQMTEFQTYFESKSWYKVNPNYDYTDDNNNLNDIEKTNVDTILSVENSK